MIRKLLILFIISIGGNCISQDLNIVSWNLRDFGQSRDSDEIIMIADVIKNADLVCIQEVVAKNSGGAQAVAKLTEILSRKGSKWEYRISDPTNDMNPHKRERYAFLWKPHLVQLKGQVSLINELDQQVCREPSFATFVFKGEEVNVLNYHACTHNKAFPERFEINAITEWITDTTFGNIVWCGDMNLKITDIGFQQALDLGFKSALNGEKTSLKRYCTEGRYKSRAEDNVLYKLDGLKVVSKNVLDFINENNCDEVEWKWISFSDHLPIQITIKE